MQSLVYVRVGVSAWRLNEGIRRGKRTLDCDVCVCGVLQSMQCRVGELQLFEWDMG